MSDRPRRPPGRGSSRAGSQDRTPKRSRRGLVAGVGRVVAAVEAAGDVASTVYTAIDQIIVQLRDELGITGGRLYERDGEGFVLRATFGDARPVRAGLRVPRSYPPIAQGLEHGVVVVNAEDPDIDRQFEAALGVEEFAVVELGDGRFVLGLDITPSLQQREVVLTLGIVRRSINQVLVSAHTTAILTEARAIQASILPRQAPVFPPYDVAGKSVPLETVGGDLLDFIPLGERVLALVVADVAGHGFPAALQVRDVYTGLRMGLGREYKMIYLLARLNRIIHHSTLTSRFVSLFYGEMEKNGVLIYINAGHPPPLCLRADGQIKKLEQGGPVLGPLPDASYERGFVRLDPGDSLIAYTDGIIETEGGDDGTELGVDGLAEMVRDLAGRSARAIIDAVYQRLEAWSGGAKPADDRTVMVAVRPDNDRPSEA